MNLVHSLVAKHSGVSEDHDRATRFIAIIGSNEGTAAKRTRGGAVGHPSAHHSRQHTADRRTRSQASGRGPTRIARRGRKASRWPARRISGTFSTRRSKRLPSARVWSKSVPHSLCPSESGAARERSAVRVDLRSDWASVALSWIANCPFRHLCNRSVQVFRALKVPVMQQTLADILARLSETVGSARDEGTLRKPRRRSAAHDRGWYAGHRAKPVQSLSAIPPPHVRVCSPRLCDRAPADAGGAHRLAGGNQADPVPAALLGGRGAAPFQHRGRVPARGAHAHQTL